MITVLLAVAILALFFVALSVRLLLVKDGEFKGTCASMNPELMKKGIDCGCGKKAGECQTARLQEIAK